MTTITTSKMIMMKMTSRIYTTNPVVAIQRFQQHQLQLKQRYNSSHVRFLSSIQVHNNNNNINNQQQRRITIQKQHQNIYNNNSIYNIRSSYINNSNNNNHRRYLSSYPSHQLVGLPSLSPTMESGTIASWNVNVGDMYHPGDSLCSIETDKATVDFEAQDDGYVAKILVDAATGNDIPVGSPIMITVEDKNDIAAFENYIVSSSDGGGGSAAVIKELSSIPTPPEPVVVAPTTVVATTPPSATSTGKVFASPAAHRLAKEMGYDVKMIHGTGPDGRIIAADVKEYVKPSSTAVATTTASAVPTTAMTTTTPPAPTKAVSSSPIPVGGDGYTDYNISEQSAYVAEQYMHSKRNVPHYYLTIDICLDELLSLRSKLNDPKKDLEIGVYEFLIKAAAMSMKVVPSVNASWMDQHVRVYNDVNINLVLGSGETLCTPIMYQCSTKGLQTISSELNTMMNADTTDAESNVGTFTIMNLGMYGIKSCASIIREPQSCSLAIGTIENRIVPGSGGEELYKQSTYLTATMACDHRVVDGAVGAQWLSTFKTCIENPTTLLL